MAKDLQHTLNSYLVVVTAWSTGLRQILSGAQAQQKKQTMTEWERKPRARKAVVGKAHHICHSCSRDSREEDTCLAEGHKSSHLSAEQEISVKHTTPTRASETRVPSLSKAEKSLQ